MTGTAIGDFGPASWEILDPRLSTQFSPCGMVWEHLRSCYQFTMRVYVGGQAVLLPARWFWCVRGAQPFPGVHGCESSVWLKNAEVNTDWGEVTPYPTDPNAANIRGLDRGGNAGYPGQCFVGNPQWFLDGQLPAGILDGPAPPFMPCCKPSPATATGGILLGGSAVPFVGAPVLGCAQCPGGAPATWLVHVAGGTGGFAALNGTWPLHYVNACGWSFVQGTFSHQLRFVGAGPWSLLMRNGVSANFAAQPTTTMDCVYGGSYSVSSSVGAGTPPTSITVSQT